MSHKPPADLSVNIPNKDGAKSHTITSSSSNQTHRHTYTRTQLLNQTSLTRDAGHWQGAVAQVNEREICAVTAALTAVHSDFFFAFFLLLLLQYRLLHQQQYGTRLVRNANFIPGIKSSIAKQTEMTVRSSAICYTQTKNV